MTYARTICEIFLGPLLVDFKSISPPVMYNKFINKMLEQLVQQRK
jgi:hypothetical protein